MDKLQTHANDKTNANFDAPAAYKHDYGQEGVLMNEQVSMDSNRMAFAGSEEF